MEGTLELTLCKSLEQRGCQMDRGDVKCIGPEHLAIHATNRCEWVRVSICEVAIVHYPTLIPSG